MNVQNLIQRTITGVLFVAIIVGCILYNPLSFGILFAAITALTLHEFAHIVNRRPETRVSSLLTLMGGTYLFFAFMAYKIGAFDGWVFIPYLLLLIALLVRELYLKQSSPFNNWAYSFMGQLYIALPFSLLNVLAFDGIPGLSVEYNPILPLAIFIFIWVNDTGAYCVGVTCGKHRLFERISPKKSWEGSIGGCVFSVIAACILAHYFDFLSLPAWIGFSLVVTLFGTWGDLVESLMKRQLGIKDSGSILPGHGGWLDRFDSALMAIPAVVIYLGILRYLL